jgi:hypothetical protein
VTATPTSLLRRLLGARGAALLSTGALDPGKPLIVVAILGAALWCGALARADTTPSPTTPTTTTDAPPPDPYKAPTPSVKKQSPARHVVVTHSAPVAVRPRTYTPPAVAAPAPAVRPTSRPKVPRHARVVRKHRKRTTHAKPVSISLAPLADIVAAVRSPLPTAADDEQPYRLLAGIALAVLAVAGSGLLVFSVRAFRTGWE